MLRQLRLPAQTALGYVASQELEKASCSPKECFSNPQEKLFKPAIQERVSYSDFSKVYSVPSDSKKQSEHLLRLVEKALSEEPVNMYLLKVLLNAITEENIHVEASEKAINQLGEEMLHSIQVSDK